MKLKNIDSNLEKLIDIAVTESGEFINSKKEICELLKKKKILMALTHLPYQLKIIKYF